MNSIPFEVPDEHGVILLLAVIDHKFTFRLALDTAATHTTLDSNMLFLAGYELKNSTGEAQIETANGAIRVELYEVQHLECAGLQHSNFSVQVYDFLAHGITTEYDGVVGLDFFRNHKFCVDLRTGELTLV
ncbi:aspartyl protease family protein [Aliterella atlantica]|uniref:Aspartyl protease n=1 Tax=Aliterella atlantica CENA595 TaxID=1618023 RepID=A0A0D8ZLP8_9CYAN|nr:aspartyl protease family protein [Aliterella atlantica]KJH69349.1 hypothetical protein UH38_24410 [Aliterella atlantica CENA595]